MDTFGEFTAIFDKANNFRDFLVAFLHTTPLLERNLL